MSDLGVVIEQLKDRLPEYLRSHGYTPDPKTKKFKCLHPIHSDSHPSASIIDANPSVWHCFGCGASGNIFHAATYLEGLPLQGVEFVKVTLRELCKRFAIEFDADAVDVDDQALQQLRIYQVIHEAAEHIKKHGARKHAVARCWTEDTCRELGIGTMSFDLMRKHLLDSGFDDQCLEEAGIDKQLFNENGLTFVLRDRWGRPSGFMTRNMNWTKGDPGSKYVNTPGRVCTFNKSMDMYGLHTAKSRYREVVLVEGHPCVVTAWQHNIRNVVAIGSTELSEEQVDLLSKLGINSLVLCFDADKAGSKATLRALDKVLAGRDGLNVKIMDLTEFAKSETSVLSGPERKPDHCDLDELLRMDPNGLRKVTKEDSFSWRLKQFDRDTLSTEICELMIPLVVNESRAVRREVMVDALAEHTGIRKKAIQQDLDGLVDEQSKEIKEQIEQLRRDAVTEIKKATSGELKNVVSHFNTRLDELERTIHPDALYSLNETLTFIEETRARFERTDSGLRGLDTGYPRLNKATRGIPKNAGFIAIAAQPNVGKTAYVGNIILGILNSRKNTNFQILHFSIDDNRETTLARMVALDSKVDIDKVQQPSSATRIEQKAIAASWDRIAWFIRQGWYDLRDASQGASLDYLEAWIRHAHEAHPARTLTVILDNFHKLDSPAKDERIKFKNASSRIHLMKNDLRLGRPTFITTMELIKTQGREPGQFDLAESNKMLYDTDMMLMLYSDHADKGANAEMFWTRPDPETGEAIMMPVVKISVQKNKISGFKGQMWYKFHAHQNWFEELDGKPFAEYDEEKSKWE